MLSVLTNPPTENGIYYIANFLFICGKYVTNLLR